MRTFIFALIFAAVTAANPITACPPQLSPDGIPVDIGCFGVGANITAYPGSFWNFSFEDVDFFTETPDADHNDWMGSLEVDPLGVSGVVTFTGSSAGRWNTLYFGGLPLLATNLNLPGDHISITTTPNGDVPFVLKSSDYILGDFFYGMGTIQDWAVCERNCQPSTVVPEPAGWVVMGIGMIVILVVAGIGNIALYKGSVWVDRRIKRQEEMRSRFSLWTSEPPRRKWLW